LSQQSNQNKLTSKLQKTKSFSIMKSVAATTTLLALLGSTSAFAPVSQRSSNSAAVTVTTALSAALIDDMVGALDPVGLFDPLGFAEKADDNTLKRYREAELTHGRVAMLAVVGFLVGEQVEGSSFLFDSQITGPAITHLAQVP
jgi:glutamine phosphoribosylpyrophosphate amidotransferase